MCLYSDNRSFSAKGLVHYPSKLLAAVLTSGVRANISGGYGTLVIHSPWLLYCAVFGDWPSRHVFR